MLTPKLSCMGPTWRSTQTTWRKKMPSDPFSNGRSSLQIRRLQTRSTDTHTLSVFPMAGLSNSVLLRPSLTSPSSPRALPHHRISPRASADQYPNFSSKNRRQFLGEVALAAVPISIAPLIGFPDAARSAEPPLSDWERIYLPVDPGVVLLDIAFVPGDPNHGLFVAFS